MRDDRVERVAEILTKYSIPMERGRLAVIEGSTLGERLMLRASEPTTGSESSAGRSCLTRR